MLNMKNAFLTIGFTLLICGNGPAVIDEQPSSDQFKIKAVSLLVKTSLKAYLINSDFQSLKNEKVAEINRRTAPQFEADYSQAWAVLKKCPGLVSKYRLRQTMTKPEVLKIISRLTRNDCLAAVDNIPDAVIVDQFNKCMNDPEIQNKPLNEQINIIMKKIFARNGN